MEVVNRMMSLLTLEQKSAYILLRNVRILLVCILPGIILYVKPFDDRYPIHLISVLNLPLINIACSCWEVNTLGTVIYFHTVTNENHEPLFHL